MNRIFRRIFFFLSISFLFFRFPLSSEALTVRVLLASGVSSATISAPHSICLHDASGKKTTHVGLAPAFNEFRTISSCRRKTRALPVTLESSAPMMFGKTRFRGNIRISGAPDGLAVINVVDSETYLRGVLKMEANPAWPNEALKAQAIVSRTYALRRISGSNGREYDVSDSIESQVYRGVNAEDPRCDAAIRSTQGIVLSYGGSIAFTPFHSDSGGNTADIRDVWGGSYPYLSALKEPVSYASPNSAWKRQLSASEIESILLRLKKSVGRISNVSVQAADSAGRAVTLLFSGSEAVFPSKRMTSGWLRDRPS
jgi:stage II sporulation protein D